MSNNGLRQAEETREHAVPLKSTVLSGLLLFCLLSGCAGLPDNSGRGPSYVIDDSANTKLGELLSEKISEHPGKDGVLLLPHGPDAFVARASLSRLAERSIDAQYYLWQQDTVGRLLIEEMLDAADRGVRVRLLIDDMYGNEGQDTWLALDTHSKIEVRLFNPFSRSQPRFWQFMTRLEDVNYRMHSKSFTVDNQVTIVGGRNIGDEYFEASPDLVFADRDALTVGPAVSQVSTEFDEYWNSEHAYPVSTLLTAGSGTDLQVVRDRASAYFAESSTVAYVQAVEKSKLANELRSGKVEFLWGTGKVIHDSSEKVDHEKNWHPELLISQLAPYITESTEEVIIVSPYFVPGEKAKEALCELAQKGARVQILTNSLASNDVTAVHAGYSRYRKPLLRCGVELYELNEALKKEWRRAFGWLPGLKKSGLHAKMMAFDREIIFIGSFNFDQRSLHINNEIGLLFEQPNLAGPTSDEFERKIDKIAFKVELHYADDGRESLRWRGIQNGEEVVFDSEPYASLGSKLAVWLLKLMPIESQL